MKWILIIIATIAGLVAIMAIIGALLPKRHVASRTAKFSTDAETIWKTMTDFASVPSWWPEVKEMKRLPDRNGHEVWVQVTKQRNMPMEVIELDPPRRMVTKVADEKLSRHVGTGTGLTKLLLLQAAAH